MSTKYGRDDKMIKTLVAAYGRVSTDSEDQLHSLKAQTDYFAHYCDEMQYDLYNVYTDEGITGTSYQKRDEFLAMLRAAGLDVDEFKGELRLSQSDRPPKFTRILVKDVSRFARNLGNAADVFERLRRKGVYVDFITANLSTEDVSADVLIKIMALLAEQESKDKSVKITFGQKLSADRGKLKTNGTYGYRHIVETDELEVIESEAEVVRLIFDLYNAGNGLRRTVGALSERGITTRRGRPFVPQSIRRILTNEIYTGTLIRNKLDSSIYNGGSPKLRPESEWVRHEGRVPQIVSREIFDTAQKEMSARIHSETRKGRKIIRGPYAGKILCSLCGHTYVSNYEKKTDYRFFVCGYKKRLGVAACGSPNIPKHRVDAIVEEVRNRDMSALFATEREDITNMIRIAVREPLVRRLDKQSEAETAKLQTELVEAENERRNWMRLFAKGKLDEETLDAEVSALDAKITKSKSEIAEMSRSNEDINKEIEEVDAIIDAIYKVDFKQAAAHTTDFIRRFIVESRHNRIIVTLNFSDFLRNIDYGRYVKLGEMLNRHERALSFPL